MQKDMRKILTIVFTSFLPMVIWGQNTINLSISDAEKIFLSQNLTLIAEKYNIDKAKANLIQTALFENPTLNFEQIAYNDETKEFFNTSSQHAVEIEQAISLSGKRSKLKEIENYNIRIAQQEFESILRELKFSLHTNLIKAFYTQKSISIFDKEIEDIDHLVKVYGSQYKKGNISLIEKSRLEALMFSLKAEQLEYINNLNEYQKELRLLMNFKQEVTIIPQLGDPNINLELLGSEQIQKYIEDNPDLKIISLQSDQEKTNLLLQKRLRIPDIAIRGVFDKASNIARNYVGLGFTVELPVFNRNQGNIKASAIQIEKNKIIYENTKNELQAELNSRLSHLRLLNSFYSKIDNSLEDDFISLIEGVGSNFEKRNINMLEFIDYYETYKETYLKIYENKTKLLNEIEEINKLLGSDYIKLWSK
ncbi:MAG: TolC family protein [Sphingobacteriia bacterium]|nr:TolC family protein [Sphingobacteriia bacterium]